MANKLTGSYDAVAQISRRQLNGLLASLHQNGASDQPPLRLGHNGVLRVGDPKPTTPELVRLRFRNWIRNFQSAGGPSNLDDFRARLVVNAPPGAAKMMEEEFSKLEKGRPGRQPSKKPRGRVQLQLSSPTIILADGATSEATLLTDVRAHYDADSGAGENCRRRPSAAWRGARRVRTFGSLERIRPEIVRAPLVEGRQD